jgi:ubiquinone/menaquinone biosynthesis C-methylase UbiE
MSQASYDAKWVEEYFDGFAEKEWDRLIRSPDREVQLAVHNHALRKFLKAGDSVLEIGAGAGRFTLTLAEIGARVLVGDISTVQLNLNRQNSQTHGFHEAVSDWRQLDMCDMWQLGDETFDAVVAIGGPLSYVLDHRQTALNECKRVTKPGGVIILGVMTLWGTIHQYLEGVIEFPETDNDKIIETGDLTQSNSEFATHFCHLFRGQELRELLETSGLKVEFMSASNALSAVWREPLEAIRADESRWAQLVKMEILACQSTGLLDAGTHLIAVARK